MLKSTPGLFINFVLFCVLYTLCICICVYNIYCIAFLFFLRLFFFLFCIETLLHSYTNRIQASKPIIWYIQCNKYIFYMLAFYALNDIYISIGKLLSCFQFPLFHIFDLDSSPTHCASRKIDSIQTIMKKQYSVSPFNSTPLCWMLIQIVFIY